jgi:hypothetical protein
MSEKPIPNARPGVYAAMLPALIETARPLGYALAVHGSLGRDFDLVAVPWVDDACAPLELAEALRECVGGYWKPRESNGVGGSKAHGRRCWSIHLGGGCYLDISIMPRLQWDFEKLGDGTLALRLRELAEDAPARQWEPEPERALVDDPCPEGMVRGEGA